MGYALGGSSVCQGEADKSTEMQLIWMILVITMGYHKSIFTFQDGFVGILNSRSQKEAE